MLASTALPETSGPRIFSASTKRPASTSARASAMPGAAGAAGLVRCLGLVGRFGGRWRRGFVLVAPGREGECETDRDRGGAADQREGHREPVTVASGTQRVGRPECSGVASPTPCQPRGWGLFSGRARCGNSGVRAGYRRYGPPASAPGPSLKKRRECRDARAARSPQGGGDARTAYKFRKQASGAREGAMKALAAAQAGKLAQEAFSRDHLRASPADRRQYCARSRQLAHRGPTGGMSPSPQCWGFMRRVTT